MKLPSLSWTGLPLIPFNAGTSSTNVSPSCFFAPRLPGHSYVDEFPPSSGGKKPLIRTFLCASMEHDDGSTEVENWVEASVLRIIRSNSEFLLNTLTFELYRMSLRDSMFNMKISMIFLSLSWPSRTWSGARKKPLLSKQTALHLEITLQSAPCEYLTAITFPRFVYRLHHPSRNFFMPDRTCLAR